MICIKNANIVREHDVLENGVIAESGTHDELIESGGLYSELSKKDMFSGE